ncbi:hypothetical protein Taro_043110 [Colocasia esculenta]|uniref:QWRF motif-containing protein 2 n=1 Tax=Colocasia esculenta TaxID=4460 RepID=A0A843X3M1_COLES|nr:hypothetical protein [Colocasia esculenta]
MVAATTATPAAAARPRNLKNPSGPREGIPNPSRPPLIPSEKDNAAVSRRPRTKEVTSRYLSSYAPSCSSSTSTSSASTATTATTATSSSSSSSTPSSRRYPSPLLNSRPPSTPAPALLPSTGLQRSQSTDRTRPVTPRPDHSRSSNAAAAEAASATRALCTTRTLPVSFQGESFFLQTSKAKAETPNSTRKPTPDRRRAATTPTRSNRSSGASDHLIENSWSGDHHLWPAARTKKSNPLMRSLDYSLDNKDSIFATMRLMQHSMILEEGRRTSVDGGDSSAFSDTDSVSSGSNSGAHEAGILTRARVTPRGISVPARFWQETNSRLRRLAEPGSPLSPSLPKAAATPKLVPVKKSSVDSPTMSPRTVSSPLRGPIRCSSPSKVVASPARAMASPSRMRSSGALAATVPIGQPGNAPSIISFAAEVRRAKKGENKIEEAHSLRLLHNRYLQWRYVNARATSSLTVQSGNAEKNIHNAWITTTEMRDSVTIKKIKLHLLKQDMKLASILKEQMSYLEEWSFLDREHSTSLSGAIEALKASTLRLPVVGGAKANLRDVKDAIGSAFDVLQTMISSTGAVLLKVEEISSLVSELAKLAGQEQALMDQSRDLLCSVASNHVLQCSLRGHLLQLKRRAT